LIKKGLYNSVCSNKNNTIAETLFSFSLVGGAVEGGADHELAPLRQHDNCLPAYEEWFLILVMVASHSMSLQDSWQLGSVLQTR
jgi:hypothetical protein